MILAESESHERCDALAEVFLVVAASSQHFITNGLVPNLYPVVYGKESYFLLYACMLFLALVE